MPLSMLLAFAFLLMLSATALSQEPGGEVLKQLEKKQTLPKPEEPGKAPVIQQQKESESQRVKESKKVRTFFL